MSQRKRPDFTKVELQSIMRINLHKSFQKIRAWLSTVGERNREPLTGCNPRPEPVAKHQRAAHLVRSELYVHVQYVCLHGIMHLYCFSTRQGDV